VGQHVGQQVEAVGACALLEELKTHLELLLLQHVQTVVDVILFVQHQELTFLRADNSHHALSIVLNILHSNLLHPDKPQHITPGNDITICKYNDDLPVQVLVVSPTVTHFGARSFAVAGPKASNHLPADIRASDSVNSFKRALKTFLFR